MFTDRPDAAEVIAARDTARRLRREPATTAALFRRLLLTGVPPVLVVISLCFLVLANTTWGRYLESGCLSAAYALHVGNYYRAAAFGGVATVVTAALSLWVSLRTRALRPLVPLLDGVFVLVGAVLAAWCWWSTGAVPAWRAANPCG